MTLFKFFNQSYVMYGKEEIEPINNTNFRELGKIPIPNYCSLHKLVVKRASLFNSY